MRVPRNAHPILSLFLLLAILALPTGVRARESSKITQGQAEFTQRRCPECHGLEAAGDGPRHSSFIPPPANLTATRDTPTMIASIIRNGIQGTAMPPNRVSDEEIAEILAYVLSRPLDTTHQWSYPWSLRGAPPPPTMGRGIFITTCSGCHGVTGDGRTTYAQADPHFWPKPADFHARNSDLGRNYDTITKGRPGTMMAPQAIKLTVLARWAVTRYVTGLLDPKSGATIPTGPAASYRNLYSSRFTTVVKRGEDTYNLYCVGCHGGRGNGTFLAVRLTDRVWFYGGGTDNAVFMVTVKGIPGRLHPSFRQLSNSELWSVITYLRSRGGLPDPLARTVGRNGR